MPSSTPNPSDSTAKINGISTAQSADAQSADVKSAEGTSQEVSPAVSAGEQDNAAPATPSTASESSSHKKVDEPSEAATSESPATAETFEEPTPAQQTEENPWVETVKTIGVSIVLALGLRAAIVEARYIPSGSMLPTLEINDRLIVEKVSYHFNDPQRGDIVVFSPTDRLRQDNPDLRDAFIKRIIGLPGEMVEITGGQVFINGESIEENYIPAEYAPDYEWGPEEVPEGEYLVLGDNRNNSYDSHFWGYVPKRNIIGRAVIRFWPPQRVGTIDPIPVYLEDSNPDAVQPEIPAEGATTP
ncbi:signal peptidase I [filamentous cyanobacterium LEGE 07170]|nr:signal peptidase I [filamentous cyanobacterium LEGE 07170]